MKINCKIFFAFVSIALLTNKIVAQDSVSKYPFIAQEYNHLYFSSDSLSFLNFFKKIDSLSMGKKTRVNIVHIGGSHVQAGIWSNVFLAAFQDEYKTTGGGYFSFPFKIAKTNSQPYATSFSNGNWERCRSVGREYCQPLGMNAMNISTNDSTNFFGISFTTKAACKKVNVVKVFHNFNTSFEFNACNQDSLKVERKDFRKSGYTLFKFPIPLDSVMFELIRKDTLVKDFLLYGFSLESDLEPGFYLAGLGANGASTTSFLRCSDLIPQMESLNGDLFILSLGVNDTQSKGFLKEDFIENYDTLINVIKKTNPNTAIILTTTTDNFIRYKTSNKRTITAKDAAFELMNRHNVAVWDLFSIMGGYRSMLKWQRVGLASKDKVHFSNKGYTIVGGLMYEAVNKSYINNQKKNKESK
ncbi:GDSL-type esterase/lipase family protein [Aurantibacillus circumpalustris]|uniref:GDSL-type esterase/lipase family protein n=1 Tax=Aurantibacillus circumpalustris TaxID=3036359 RepID=UPI00295A6765|nr:GDSL-type esterase/lipase family protein [Aurantibacillus circumpalustris]